MKFLLSLLVALSLTLAWQSSVVAEEKGSESAQAQEQTKDAKAGETKKKKEEPDCE